MHDTLSIARPYAKALFEFAVEQGSLASWDKRLRRISTVMQDAQIKKLLANPFLDAHFWSELLAQCLGEPASEEFIRLIAVLHRNRRLSVLSSLQQLFHGYVLEREGRVALTVRCAQPLSTDQQSELQATLEKQLKHALELHYEIDPALMAGIQLVRGNQIFDGSLSKRLEQMADYLKV